MNFMPIQLGQGGSFLFFVIFNPILYPTYQAQGEEGFAPQSPSIGILLSLVVCAMCPLPSDEKEKRKKIRGNLDARRLCQKCSIPARGKTRKRLFLSFISGPHDSQMLFSLIVYLLKHPPPKRRKIRCPSPILPFFPYFFSARKEFLFRFCQWEGTLL